VAESVPFFFKQWGGRTSKSGGRLLSGKVYGEMPEVEIACVNSAYSGRKTVNG